jgi:hypothetical protein
LPGKTVREVVASAHDKDRVYVVLSGKGDNDSASYVYVTNDFGATWESIAGNLPDESVNTLAEDSETKELLFVGTDLGIYVCTNSALTKAPDGADADAKDDAEGDDGDRQLKWDSLCHTLPTAPVVDIAVHGRDGALVAATHGLSIFLLEIDKIRAARGE